MPQNDWFGWSRFGLAIWQRLHFVSTSDDTPQLSTVSGRSSRYRGLADPDRYTCVFPPSFAQLVDTQFRALRKKKGRATRLHPATGKSDRRSPALPL